MTSLIFGNPTPQPTLTSRSSNPTRFRSLDIGRGAIGSLLLNTTTLSNGVHTIMWGVTDSASRGEGLGSRYFTVLNGGSRPTGRDAPVAPTADTRSGRPFEGLVRARTGLDLDAPSIVLEPGPDGVRHVQVSDLGRLDVALGEVEAGWVLVNGERRALPAGSQVDATSGTFTWAPGVGFHGTYRLQFQRAADLVTLDVTIRPATAAPAGAPEVAMNLDAPGRGATVSGAWAVAGWALDPLSDVGAGFDAVHVWAQRTDVAAAAPVFLGAATLGGERHDLAAAFGPQFDRVAFSLTVPARVLPAGVYDVTAYVWNRRTTRWEDARTAGVVVK